MPANAQPVGPLVNTTVGNARLLVPDGSSVRQAISPGETRWFVFGAEPGKTYVIEAVDPDSDLTANTIGAMNVFASDGTTTPPSETNVDCTSSLRAPALELPAVVNGMRCVVRAFPPSTGNTQNKRGLYAAVSSVVGPGFDIRVRESTIYGRWTTNGYDMHVELENTTADSICAEVTFLPNTGDTYAGTWSGGVTTVQLTIPAFGANKTVLTNGTLVGPDNKGTLRIGACPSPVNFVSTSLHASTYGHNPLTDKFLYFFTSVANNGATSSSWSPANSVGTGTVTNVATGAGLTGGPITTTGTINLAPTNLLPTVACTVNQIPKWNGSAWTCAADDNSGGTVSGLGTPNHVAKWTGATSVGDTAIFESAAGNVGIGTSGPVPANHLQIGNTPGFSGNDLAIGNGSKAMSFFQSATVSTWFSSTNFALMPNGGSGWLGIGTQTPANKVQIGDVGGSGFQASDIAFGNGTQASAIGQFVNVAQWESNTDIVLFPKPLTGGGRVGINTDTPVNKLQIGHMGASGFTGNDIAFGNGTQAAALAQTTTVAWWYSNTDIALMPQSGSGLVGINTTAPHYPLEVQGAVGWNNGYRFFNFASPLAIGNFTAQIGILAGNSNVAAFEFDAYSDERIKDIVGVSDSASDLATINALQVTDYTMKDKAVHGNRAFKKLVAQQVEKVYPQAVSKHADYIPNVYRAASSVTPTGSGVLLHFDRPHRLSAQAKRVKVLASRDNVMQQVTIVSVPSARDVVIAATRLNGDKVFVYGEQVDDFRTIDYEGLTALNISATQELSTRVARQQAATEAIVSDDASQLAEMRKRLAEQDAELAELRQRVSAAEILHGEIAQLRADFAALRESRMRAESLAQQRSATEQ